MEMPVLKPIPIVTRGLPWWCALFVWLFKARRFELYEDYVFRLPTGEPVVVPKGFVFDGASIPRLFWWLLNPIGLLLIPGLLHDYAYRHRYLLMEDRKTRLPFKTRRESDAMFFEVCHVTNGMVMLDMVCTLLIRFFGWWSWNKHRRRDKDYG